jgi:hypothetical protein
MCLRRVVDELDVARHLVVGEALARERAGRVGATLAASAVRRVAAGEAIPVEVGTRRREPCPSDGQPAR